MPNLSELRTAVAYKTNMSTGSSSELARIDAWLNEAYEDVLARTACRVECADLTTIADTWKYNLPNTILDVLEVWMEGSDSETVPFERTSSRHIIRLRAGLETATGSPPSYFATEGMNALLLWPTPTTEETINLLYVPRPTALSATGDTPSDLPSEWHKALEYYALWQAGDADDSASSKKGEYYRQLYEGPDGMGGFLDKIRKQMRQRGGRRLAPVDLSTPLRVTSRSVDVGWR